MRTRVCAVPASCSCNCRTMRDLPMPASPDNKTTCPSPPTPSSASPAVPAALPSRTLKRQSPSRRNRIEPGTDGLRRLALLRPRPAEIGQDPVAEIIRDIAAMPQHDGGQYIVITPQKLAEIL